MSKQTCKIWEKRPPISYAQASIKRPVNQKNQANMTSTNETYKVLISASKKKKTVNYLTKNSEQFF